MLKDNLKQRYVDKRQKDWLAATEIVNENIDFLKKRVETQLNYIADSGAESGYIKDLDIFGGDSKWNDDAKNIAKSRIVEWLTKEGLNARSGKELFVDGWKK